MKPKIIWLLSGSADSNLPSRRLRVLEIIPYLSDVFEQKFYSVPRSLLQAFYLRGDLSNADVIVVQKELPSWFILLFLRSFKAKLVYDFDDAVYIRNTPKTLAGFKYSNKLEHRFRRICRNADLLIAGNKYLAYTSQIYGAKTVKIIPTSVPVPSKSVGLSLGTDGVVKIGWIGTKVNLHFLESMEDIFLQLQTEGFLFQVCVMADKKPEFINFSKYTFEKWSPVAEEVFLRSIDLGLMPLKNNLYNQGKCAYKALQYMSFGKPVIVSDVGVNAEWTYGAGFSVSNDEEMISALRQMLSDEGLRFKFGNFAYDIVVNRFDRRKIAEQLKSVIYKLMES